MVHAVSKPSRQGHQAVRIHDGHGGISKMMWHHRPWLLVGGHRSVVMGGAQKDRQRHMGFLAENHGDQNM
jgi:hypothetical protein